MAQVFSYEFCEMFKKTFFTEHLRTTAFVFLYFLRYKKKTLAWDIICVIYVFQRCYIYAYNLSHTYGSVDMKTTLIIP